MLSYTVWYLWYVNARRVGRIARETATAPQTTARARRAREGGANREEPRERPRSTRRDRRARASAAEEDARARIVDAGRRRSRRRAKTHRDATRARDGESATRATRANGTRLRGGSRRRARDGRVGEDATTVDAGVGGDGGARRRRGESESTRDRVDVGGGRAGKRVKSPGSAGRGTAARRESEAHAKAALAAVMGAPRDVYVNLPTYSESASAHHDDEMALPVSIFDDPLLEEMPFFVETSKRKLEIGSMSPVAANRKRLSIDVPEPFDDVCESSPLGIPRRRRRLSANGRRTTLHELLSPRRTLNMGVSEESKRVHDLKPTDLDSARETPQVVAQKAVSRSQSLSSMARDADGRVSPTGAFKAALRSPEIVGPRDTLSRQLSRGLSCEKLFNTSASPARVA